jgi:hypothetical protein
MVIKTKYAGEIQEMHAKFGQEITTEGATWEI